MSARREPRPPVLSAAVLLLALVASAPAADPLRLENALPVAPVRTGGPAYVTGELQWDRPELLEGRLRFVLRDGTTVLSAVETDTMALVTGVTPFRQILPMPTDSNGYRSLDAVVQFLAEEERFDLGTIPIRTPAVGSWESVVLVAESQARINDAEAAVFRDRLNLNHAFAAARQGVGASVDCFLPTLPANQFPEQPLAYCAFDVVGLPPVALQRMNGRQLDAIAAWVRAGGAVAVGVDGALEAKHAEFLNELFRDTGGGPFLLDDAGHVGEPEGTRDRLFARRAGVGHAAVIFGDPRGFGFETAAWRGAHARLWKLREEYVRRREGGGHLLPAPPALQSPDIVFTDGFQVQSQGVPIRYGLWTVPTPSFGTAVVNAMRPKDLRLVPGWAVALLLMGYVAVVGPLDYFLLGRFRLRRWTWATFPAVTLAVTWGVVATADSFMSDNDHRRTVDVVDFDAKGEPVRRTRLEMLFRGSTGSVVNEVTRAYFSPLSPDHFGDEENSAPTGPYAGTLPSRYAVPQQVAKWTPQVNRTFEIAPADVPAIDWAKMESDASSGPVSLPGGAPGHVSRLKNGQLGAGVLGYVDDQPNFRFSGRVPNQMPYGYQPVYGARVSFLQAAGALAQTERGAVQYARSPLGLGRLDDLPFFDSSAESQDAFVIWTQEPDGDLVIYRKPVAGNEDD